MPTIDGRVRLYRVIQSIAGGLDRHHALQGIGVIILFGNVISPFPDLKVALESVAQLPGSDLLYLTPDNLLIPDDIRLSKGDRIALMPVQADNTTRFMVQCKIRTTDIQPVENTRMGYNGDLLTPNNFVGVEVQVTGENEDHDSVAGMQGDIINIISYDGAQSAVSVKGRVINITSYGGAQVVIDGINFKGHTHTVPGGAGNSGPPH